MRLPTRTDRPWMPDYGLSGSKDGLLAWSWAVDHLLAAPRFWVSCITPLGERDFPQRGEGTGLRAATPHLSAVWGVWVEDALWFSCGARSRKARNLLLNGRCTAAIERADEAVTITGHAGRVSDGAVLGAVTDAYVAKYGDGFPDPVSNPLFALSPEVVIGIIEREPDFSTRATRWTFAPRETGPD